MIKDERISKAQTHVAAVGYAIVTILLAISLLYRVFVLGQAVVEYWDIALVYFTGTLYVTITSFAKGAVPESTLTRLGKRIIPVIVITVAAVNYLQGNLNTVTDLLTVILSALVGLSLMGALVYYLYRRWERQSGLG